MIPRRESRTLTLHPANTYPNTPTPVRLIAAHTTRIDGEHIAINGALWTVREVGT